MVVHDLDILHARSGPAEAHTELIIHADTVLPGAVAFECLQSVARRHTEVFEPACDLQLPQLASRDSLDAHEPFDPPAFRERLCVGALECLDHRSIVTSGVINVKRDALIALRGGPAQSPSTVEGPPILVESRHPVR